MQSVVVSAPADEVELAADVLWSLGVVAIEERSTASGAIELWTSVGDEPEALDAVRAAIGGAWTWWTVEVDERIADTWRDHVGVVRIDDGLVVVPAWRPDLAVEERPGTIVLSIEPGPTFGLGDHPTTRSCLVALRRELERRPGAAVLDVGCGSGILAVAAIRFGARHCVAIDIAPAAVPVTTDNAVRNGVGGAVSVSTTPLGDVDGRYDVVMANILAPALVELSADLVRCVADDGVLVISGVIADRFEHVVAALRPLRPVRVDLVDGWATVTLGCGPSSL